MRSDRPYPQTLRAAAGVWLGLGCVIGSAFAQPPVEIEEAAAADGAVVQAGLPIETFDQMILRDQSETALRKQLGEHLQARLSAVHSVCELTPLQVRKLKLAGQADISRVFNEMAVLRQSFARERADPAAAERIMHDLRRLQSQLTRQVPDFEHHSIFHKIALTSLTAEQLVPYRQQLEQRQLERRRAFQNSVVKLLEKVKPLWDEQKTELIALLDDLPKTNAGSYESTACWYFAAQIPEAEYQKILGEDHLNVLNARFQNAKNYGPRLKLLGILVEDVPANDILK